MTKQRAVTRNVERQTIAPTPGRKPRDQAMRETAFADPLHGDDDVRQLTEALHNYLAWSACGSRGAAVSEKEGFVQKDATK
jgi:hypothetical protein